MKNFKFLIFNFYSILNFLIFKNSVIKNSLEIRNLKLEIPHLGGAGQSLIELIIAIAIAAIVIPALFYGMITSTSGKAQETQRLQAVTLLREGLEAVRSVRERDWNTNIANKTIGANYHPVITGNIWDIVPNSEPINQFIRVINFFSVYRDNNGNIFDTPGAGRTLDLSTIRSVITVTWNTPLPSSINSTLYLTRYLNNASNQQTTQADFNSGIMTAVIVTNNSGGEVSLGSVDTGRSDWCVPNVLGNKLNLPKNGAARSVWANPGAGAAASEAFVGLGVDTAIPSMVKVSITNTVAPTQPVPSQAAVFNTGYIVNHIFGVGNFTYLATTDNTKEIVIAQQSGATFTEIGSFRPTGNIDATSVFVSGTRGFMTQGNVLRIFDLSSNTGIRNQLGSATFGTTSSITGKLFVRGNYAYVALRGDARELEIFNITTNTPVKVAWADVNGAAAQDIFVNPDGDRAYMVTNFDASLPEFFIIDTTNKNLPLHQLPSPIGSYNTLNSMSPTAVEVVLSDYRAVLVGSAGEEYTVLSLLNESVPVRCGGIDIGQTIYDISAIKEVDGDAYAYITTSRTAADNFEFRMVEGGPGPLLAPEGTFESAPTTMASSTSFNRFDAVFDQPAGTSIKFRMAVANQVLGSCTHNLYDFLGPNGSSSTYFETTTTGINVRLIGTIPYLTQGNFINPGRCFKYRIYLYPNTAMTVSPVLKDITVNYTP